MDTLEEKLLKKMAARHFKYEILESAAVSAHALCSWVEYYNDNKSSHKLADKNIPKILANLELNIQLLISAYYPNAKEWKEQFIQATAKKYDIVDNN